MVHLRGVLLGFAGACWVATGGSAFGAEQIYGFPGAYPTGGGQYPHAGVVVGAGGVLYGTTFSGGQFVYGSVYQLTPPPAGQTSWSEAGLFSFPPPPPEYECGIYDSGPVGDLLIGPSGALIGVSVGNDLCPGVVYELAPPSTPNGAWTPSVLFSFPSYFYGGNGGLPAGGVIMGSGGDLFGTTEAGGPSASYPFQGYGTVFRLRPPAVGQSAWSVTYLHNFAGGSDGQNPSGPLVADRNGALYGVTEAGGNAGCGGSGCGTVFKLAPPTPPATSWTESILYVFPDGSGTPGSAGSLPLGGLVMNRAGVLFGTTSEGGVLGVAQCGTAIGCGTVYQLAPPVAGHTEWQETTLYQFHGTDGSAPHAGVKLGPGGRLYGTTTFGGPPNSYTTQGCGVVFRLAPPAASGGWTETVDLLGTSQDRCPNGGGPLGDVLLSGDALYFTGQYGGGRGYGTVAEIPRP